MALDLEAYRVGEVADADVVTPVALDVADAAATAELKAASARQHPAIFRGFSGATNQMAEDFVAAFAKARVNFLAEVTNEFHSQTLDEAMVNSPDFGRLVTAFGVENREFPVTDELAAEWARGKDGGIVQKELLTVLQWVAGRPVRPDVLPDGLVMSEMVRLVPVKDPDQKLSFEAAQQGPLIAAASLTTVSDAQALFRREFPARQQLFARALAAFIRPNCLPDAPLTRLTRGAAVYQMVVSDHFDAGDTIVRQGEAIDAKARAALLALNDVLKSKPPVAAVAPVIAAAPPPQAQRPAEPSPPSAPALAPKAAPASAGAERSLARALPVRVRPAGGRHTGLIVTLAGISLGALLVAGWQFLKERKPAPMSALVAQSPLPLPGVVKAADLTPQVAQAVREAVQQELAAQRRELLLAQQAATDEIAALVRRLDDLQVPMQQRLQTYENRIQLLEKELAFRNEENRELLKLKIEMISRQMDSERKTSVVSTVTASS
jgi:CRP-like cAMP-binding protein